MREASEAVGQGFDPNSFVRTSAEDRVLEGLACDFIDDSIGLWIGDVIHAQV